MTRAELEAQLAAPDAQVRLDALRQLRVKTDRGEIPRPIRTEDTNNHVHTTYSFSAYSPAGAVWKAYRSGLATVGIVDHDSVGGAREFISAGDIVGITTTVGAEIRLSFADTPLAGRRLNSPDELSAAYVACHGIPHTQLDRFDALLGRIRELRNERNRAQTEKLNALLAGSGITLDFESDVLPLSQAERGGSVTERHLLYALARKIEQSAGRGEPLIRFLESTLAMPVSAGARRLLLDEAYPNYTFDVLNVLKSELVAKFFIAGGADSLPVGEVVPQLREMGIIPTYCYLGDVGESPTGDKKAQKFEDDYLDELFPVLRSLGFEAVAYMPSRNTEAQLSRVMKLCAKHGFMEISGEDINQPRQSFVCERLREPQYAHLSDSTWALVGHEHAAGQDPAGGIFAAGSADQELDLPGRIAHFRDLGLQFRR
ncbi:MAG: PHP domain-containing protein [Clostridia bacterium]|nr:PHP domain-containing protein [Clostridia bacterium]